MQFAQPIWLAGGVLACALLAWSWRRFDAGQRAALAKFAAARLLPKLTTSISPVRRRLKRGLMLAGVALLFTALARPQSGFEMRETHRRGLELVFAVDTSKSMLAKDVKPDRLTRAKLGVTDLLDRLQGDGVGLIAFAGTAFLQCPVTLDYNAFRESLNALDTGTIPAGGTNIAGAIREAEAVFEERGTSEKILVLLTDGEDLDGDGITAAEAAAKKGVKIFTVGVGSGNGELVPVPSANGGTEFARDARGQLVKSRLDEAVLKKIAEISGGMYQPLGGQAGGLNVIYDQGLAGFKRGDLSSREMKVPLERFQWPLAAALLCLMADWMIGGRRRAAAVPAEPVVSSAAPARKAPVPSPARVGAGAAVAMVLTVLTAPGARAATPQSAEQAYQKGDYPRAHQDYAATAAKEPGRPELQFNTGSAAYKAGDYSQAVAGFQESLKNAPVAVQQDAYYNLGNTQYRLGQKTAQEKPEETIKTWEEAVKSYEAALQINPSDHVAKHNRDLVKRRIEQLKKQQDQKKDQQQDKNNNKDSKDQEDQKDSSGGQGKDQKDQPSKNSKDQQSQDKKDSGKSGNDSKNQQNQDQNQQSGDGKENQDQQEKNKSQDRKDQQSDPDKNQDPKEGNRPPDSGGQDPQDQNKRDAQSPDGKKSEDDPDSKKADKNKQDGAQDQDKADKDGKPDSGEDRENGKPQNGESEQDKDKDGKPDARPGDDPKNDSKDKGQDAGKTGKDQPQAVNPDHKPRQGDIQPANGAPPPPGAEEAAAAADRVRAAPGQMTREEARQLLEALRNDERRVPAISAQGRAGSQPINRGKIKDW